MVAASKAAYLNLLVQGGQLYRAFPISKGSLAKVVSTKGSTLNKLLKRFSYNCNVGPIGYELYIFSALLVDNNSMACVIDISPKRDIVETIKVSF